MTEETRTLTQVLAALGIRHEPHDGLRRKLYRGEELIGYYSASEGWELVAKLREKETA